MTLTRTVRTSAIPTQPVLNRLKASPFAADLASRHRAEHHSHCTHSCLRAKQGAAGQRQGCLHILAMQQHEPNPKGGLCRDTDRTLSRQPAMTPPAYPEFPQECLCPSVQMSNSPNRQKTLARHLQRTTSSKDSITVLHAPKEPCYLTCHACPLPCLASI